MHALAQDLRLYSELLRSERKTKEVLTVVFRGTGKSSGPVPFGQGPLPTHF